MSQALRKLTGQVARTNTCLVFINQLREKIGVMFGNPETTTGGRALKFYSSVRVEVRRGATLKDGDQIVGDRTKVKIVKNKVAAPFKEVEVDLLHGFGFSREARSDRSRTCSRNSREERIVVQLRWGARSVRAARTRVNSLETS